MSDYFKELYNMGKANLLSEVLNVCSPFALEDSTYDSFYVDTNEARGDDASKKIILRLRNNGNQVKRFYLWDIPEVVSRQSCIRFRII